MQRWSINRTYYPQSSPSSRAKKSSSSSSSSSARLGRLATGDSIVKLRLRLRLRLLDCREEAISVAVNASFSFDVPVRFEANFLRLDSGDRRTSCCGSVIPFSVGVTLLRRFRCGRGEEFGLNRQCQ